MSHIFRYIIKRSLQTLVVLFCVVLISFFLIRMAGGNPARMVLPESATEEAVAAMEIKLGLDKPLPVQFLMYVSDLLHGDLGTSSHYSMPVLELVTGRLPNTLLLAFSSVLVGCMLCIPMGIIAGSNKGSIIDFITMFFCASGAIDGYSLVGSVTNLCLLGKIRLASCHRNWFYQEYDSSCVNTGVSYGCRDYPNGPFWYD